MGLGDVRVPADPSDRQTTDAKSALPPVEFRATGGTGTNILTITDRQGPQDRNPTSKYRVYFLPEAFAPISSGTSASTPGPVVMATAVRAAGRKVASLVATVEAPGLGTDLTINDTVNFGAAGYYYCVGVNRSGVEAQPEHILNASDIAGIPVVAASSGGGGGGTGTVTSIATNAPITGGTITTTGTISISSFAATAPLSGAVPNAAAAAAGSFLKFDGTWAVPGGGGGSPLTTKGDVYGFSTVDARIPIGTNGQVLTADSAQTLGLKWATPTASPLTTKGDLFTFSTVDGRLPVGTNTYVLTADSTQTFGIKWAVAPGGTSGTLIVEPTIGVIDGVNTIFTLTYTPISKVAIDRDGQAVTGGVSWGQSGTGDKTITFKYEGTAPDGVTQVGPPYRSVRAIYATTDSVTPPPPDVLPPGTAWSWIAAGTQPAAQSWRRVAWSPSLGIFAVVSRTAGAVATSPDGDVWTGQTAPSSPANGWGPICWNEDAAEFLSLNVDSQHVMKSSDGVTWAASVATGLDGTGSALFTVGSNVIWVHNLGLYVASLTDPNSSTNAIVTSADGLAWTPRTTTSRPSIEPNAITYSPSLGMLVAVGDNFIDTSVDGGITWVSRTSPQSTTWHGVTWSPELAMFCGSGQAYFMTSSDGITWVSNATPPTTTFNVVVWSRTRLLFIAVERTINPTFTILSSTDGTTWNSETTPSSLGWADLCVAEEINMIISIGNLSPYAMWSPS